MAIEESNRNDESKNFTAFMASISEVTNTIFKVPKIENFDESDGTMGSLKEDEGELDDENKSELQRGYDQFYKQSYKLTNVNVKLGKKLKKFKLGKKLNL